MWVEERKIASLGVHVSRGVSTHGFAVNVDNDLEPFAWVVACGLPGVEMTSIAAELGGGASTERFCERMAASFCQVHDRCRRLVTAQELGLDAAHSTEARSSMSTTRSRANPGGMDVLQVLGPRYARCASASLLG